MSDEVDHKTGELVHFSPYDQRGQVHKGILVTDNGFWDTFRTVYPLLGLAYRKELGVQLVPRPYIAFMLSHYSLISP